MLTGVYFEHGAVSKLLSVVMHVAGTGKTSTVLAIARQLYGKNVQKMTLELNASDDRGISVVRQEIQDFASTKSVFSSTFKLIVLDECDAMTKDAQFALRRVIEKYARHGSCSDPPAEMQCATCSCSPGSCVAPNPSSLAIATGTPDFVSYAIMSTKLSQPYNQDAPGSAFPLCQMNSLRSDWKRSATLKASRCVV